MGRVGKHDVLSALADSHIIFAPPLSRLWHLKNKSSHPFQGRKEAQLQLRKFKPKDLVDSRKHIAHEYATKPWLISFFKGVFALQIKKHIRSILDVGCGTGFFTRFVSSELVALKKDSIVLGCDLNRSLLTIAKKQSSHLKFDIDYVQASAYYIPFRYHYFDLVTCRTVLMWLSSPIDALKEMKRVIMAGGYVACEEPDWGMRGHYDPDKEFIKMDQKIELASIAGREIIYGHSPAMGRRLPELFHDAGLKKMILEGTFHSIGVPSDRRIKTSTLQKELNDSLKHFSDKENYLEYKRAVLAGGISESEFNRYMRRWEGRTKKKIRELRSQSAKENDSSFYAIPFFLAIGKKGQD